MLKTSLPDMNIDIEDIEGKCLHSKKRDFFNNLVCKFCLLPVFIQINIFISTKIPFSPNYLFNVKPFNVAQ